MGNNLKDCLLGLYEKALPFSLDWDTKLSAVKELGYDFLEFSVDAEHIDRLDWTEGEIASFMDASLRTGVPAYTLAMTANRFFPLGSRDGSVREKGRALLKKSVRLAQRLGIRIVQVATYDVYGEEGDAETDLHFIESLRECERAAALSGVMLALETMDSPFADSIEKCYGLAGRIGSPWIQVYADIGNLSAAGVDFTKDIL
ncbi:MAG: L-ribulose-5-phosphate 3-epimerase, partial [Clostridiales bacterium]|nr:L-ribulose-5-phosphate 3-epimerase [Clostridiales bacterium]